MSKTSLEARPELVLAQKVKTQYLSRINLSETSPGGPIRFNQSWFDSCFVELIHKKGIYFGKGRNQSDLTPEEYEDRDAYGRYLWVAQSLVQKAVRLLEKNRLEGLERPRTEPTRVTSFPVTQEDQERIWIPTPEAHPIRSRLRKLRDELAARPVVR